MELPIRFPDYKQVVAEDAARFRALSFDEQARLIESCLTDYQSLKRISSRASEIDRIEEEEERHERNAILDFVARYHG